MPIAGIRLIENSTVSRMAIGRIKGPGNRQVRMVPARQPLTGSVKGQQAARFSKPSASESFVFQSCVRKQAVPSAIQSARDYGVTIRDRESSPVILSPGVPGRRI